MKTIAAAIIATSAFASGFKPEVEFIEGMLQVLYGASDLTELTTCYKDGEKVIDDIDYFIYTIKAKEYI